MKMFARSALFGVAGLIALSLPAYALGSAAIADTSLSASKTKTMELAARGYDPSAGSVGFKKSKKKKAKSK